jgi:hypothetical protein
LIFVEVYIATHGRIGDKGKLFRPCQWWEDVKTVSAIIFVTSQAARGAPNHRDRCCTF